MGFFNVFLDNGKENGKWPAPSRWTEKTVETVILRLDGCEPFPPYSLQKRPKPQICSKFVPAAIVFGGSSQGD